VPLEAPNLETYRAVIGRRADPGGSGGGARDQTRANKGEMPRTSPRPFVQPVMIRNIDPKLAMEITLPGPPDVRPAVFSVGDPNGILDSLSAGRGKGGGIGDGEGTRIGDHRGNGRGDADGDGPGLKVAAGFGGSMTQPVLIWKREPEYTEDARKARLQGAVVLRIEVDTLGEPKNIKVFQTLGLGLDQRAIVGVTPRAAPRSD